jgi:hypothetical protein
VKSLHRYHMRRDEHGLPGYRETTEFAADLRRLSES